MADVLAAVDPAALGKDAKTQLQEWLQARRLPLPEYVVLGTTGEAHAQRFFGGVPRSRLVVAAGGEGGQPAHRRAGGRRRGARARDRRQAPVRSDAGA